MSAPLTPATVMDEQRLQQMEQWWKAVTSGPVNFAYPIMQAHWNVAEHHTASLIAEVRRLQQQVENIAAVNDAVGRERDTAFGVRDAALDREAQAKFDIDEIGQRYLDERAAHNSTILTAIAERDAALAERDRWHREYADTKAVAEIAAIAQGERLGLMQAERDHERLRYDGMRSDRDDWRKRCEDEQAAHGLTADRYVVANRRGDGFRAALTEARRVLREVQWNADCDGFLGCPSCWNPSKEGHTSDCALAAVLAQEEEA